MSGTARKVLSVFVGILSVGLIAAFLFPIFATAKIGRGPMTLGNLRTLASSLEIYSGDNSGRLPLQNWCDATYPYNKSWNVYTSKRAKAKELNWGYAMNISTLGKKVDSFDEPPKTVLLFETDALAPNVVANLGAATAPGTGKSFPIATMEFKARAVRKSDFDTMR